MSAEQFDSVEVSLIVTHDDLDQRSDTWARQRAGLYEQLSQIPGIASVERRETPSPGDRGGPAEIVLAITSGAAAWGALTAVARAWISRDKGRRIKLRLGDLELDADAIDEATLERLAKLAKPKDKTLRRD